MSEDKGQIGEAFLDLADSLLGSSLRELERHRKKDKGAGKIPILALRIGASFVVYVRQLAGAQTMLAQLELAEMNDDEEEEPAPGDFGGELDQGDEEDDAGEGGGDEDDDAGEGDADA